jgi:hypothetical protein
MELPVRNEFYTFVATAEPGSDNSLVAEGRRLYTHAQFQGIKGGDYFFLFNGLELYLDPSDLQFANDNDPASNDIIKNWRKEKGGTRRRRQRKLKLKLKLKRKTRRRHV